MAKQLFGLPKYPYTETRDDLKIITSGYFAGASYFIPLGDVAGLTFSAAYASLTAQLQDNQTYVESYDESTNNAIYGTENQDTDLDTANGISLSATLAFDYVYIKAETQSYTFVQAVEDGEGDFENIDIEETVARVSAGLRF